MFLIASLVAVKAAGACELRDSTATNPTTGKVELPWRKDYPTQQPNDSRPWEAIEFETNWREYMTSVLATVKASGLKLEANRVVMDAGSRWWLSPWMDIGPSGREYLIGLTKERSPDRGDLAPGSPSSYQVWAIGWYNAHGAYTLGQIFRDPCDPDLASARLFREGTASFKLLFTDADPAVVTYLKEAPTVKAAVDAFGVRFEGKVREREPRELRLLQVDIAIKDRRAKQTGWVFGTFAWIGPRKGDGLFDNLRPVGLQWGNDPRAFSSKYAEIVSLSEGMVDQSLKNEGLFGWDQRPFLGFQGRVNGPADNKASSCLSCHGASQRPRSIRLRLVRSLPSTATEAEIRKHVDDYFRNIRAGELFDDTTPGAAPLDYSLQIESGFFRLCQAYTAGTLIAPKPAICPGAGSVPGAALAQDPSLRQLDGIEVPPRQ
jgi:hypothetical protein